MKEEENENIDDLLDYKFDKNDVDSNYDQDSFNQEIMKYYEDHRKTSTHKTSEVHNIQNRPISSYQRIVLSAKNIEEPENIPQEVKNENVNNEELIIRFNNHIKANKISQKDFCDNPEIYLNLEDFAELFKRIKFDISKEEINFFFQNKNAYYEETYISGNVFFINYPELEWRENTIIENNLTTEYVDYKKINNEFKVLYDDIVQKESLRPNTVKNSRLIKSALINQNKKLNFMNSRPITSIPLNININSSQNISNLNKSGKIMHKFYLDSKKKKLAEEEMMKNQLEKRRKEYEKEFQKNYEEAVELCDKYGLNKQIREEYNKNKTLSRVYCRDYYEDDNDYKKFLIRKIKKFKENMATSKLWKDDGKLDNNNIFTPEKKNIYNERQEIIKKYLIEAIRLKNKLKKQINSLKEKPVIDENFILMNFNHMNIS